MTSTVPTFCPVHGIPDCSPVLNGCSPPVQVGGKKEGDQRRVGRPVGAAGIRSRVVTMRLTEGEIAELDAMRGSLARSEWLRWLLMLKIREKRAQE